ncbi:MAG: hypothetical protein ACJ74W_19265 [Pyrinomonadaceae bacterium]
MTAAPSAHAPDPDLQHPAVRLYRDVLHHTPNHGQRAEIAATVSDLALYERVLRDPLSETLHKSHLTHKWALERYQNGGRRPGAQAQPSVSLPQPTPAERDAIARQRWQEKGGRHATA